MLAWLLLAASDALLPVARPSVSPPRQRPIALTAPQAEAPEQTPLGFSFTPGGLLFPYYVGFAYELQRAGLLTPTTPVGGSSAGAIVATALASDLSEATILDGLKGLVADYRAGASLRSALRTQLELLLPDDAPERCERRGLTVCYQRILPWPKACLTQSWESKQDLIDCVAASCCWPFFFSRWPCVWVRGGLAVDGYFALPRENFGAPPLSAERTVVVSCLPRVKVAPQSGGLVQPGVGTSFALDVEDAEWFQRAIKPASDAKLDEMVRLGREHATRWAEDGAARSTSLGSAVS